MKKDSKIYIAGHTGMVGSAIARHLQANGYTNLLTREIEELDLTRQADVEEFFESERPEYIFLAAAKVGGIYANNTYRADFIYVNLEIQNNVIHTAFKTGAKKLLFLGSSCIYPKLAPQPLKEEYLLSSVLEQTNEPYAIAKIAGLKLCESYNRQYGTNFISAMPTNLYGPNDNFDLKSSHVLPALIRKFHMAKLLAAGDIPALKIELADAASNGDGIGELKELLEQYGIYPDRLEVWGSGAPRREFLHVDDCAAALVFLMGNYDETPFLNVGFGEDITISDLASLVRDVVGYNGEIVFNPEYPDGTPRKLLDVSKLKSLGWQPSMPLREGIEATYEWYRTRNLRFKI